MSISDFDKIENIRKELELLTNEQLTLKALALLIACNLSHGTYYKVLASILRERSEIREEWR